MTTATRFSRLCPISTQQFRNYAPAGTMVADKITEVINMTPKEFSTGSFGYVGTGKIEIFVADTLVKCHVSVVVTVIDSKHAE